MTWRDIQYLTVETAVKVNDPDVLWQNTTIGKEFSHNFGYGKLDAYAIVERAKTWENVKPQTKFSSPTQDVGSRIPEGRDGVTVSFEVTEDMIKEAGLARLEHVTVTMNVDHTSRGDLSVQLVSPDNVVSTLAAIRENDDFPGGYEDWTFMSVAHW